MKPKTLSSKTVRFAFAGYFVFALPWLYFKFTLDVVELDENAIFLEYYRSRIIGVESKPSILPIVVYHDGQKSKEEWRKKNWEERNEDGNVLSGRNWSASVIYYDEESRGESEKEAKLYDKFHSKIEFHRKCELADWSRLPVSNCNLLHEVYQDDYSFLASGGVRDVWAFRSNDSQQQFVIKTLKLSKEFDIQKMEMHRVDALISERLSGSPYVVDIYAYCAQSVINAKISKTIRQLSIKRMKSEEKLRISYEAALAMNATHYFINGEKNPASFIHRDITPKNFIINKGGNVQITDFNAGHIVNSCGFVKKECKRVSCLVSCVLHTFICLMIFTFENYSIHLPKSVMGWCLQKKLTFTL